MTGAPYNLSQVEEGDVVCPCPVGGGGALRYQMDTHCQTVVWRTSGECHHIGAVSSFKGKKEDRLATLI